MRSQARLSSRRLPRYLAWITRPALMPRAFAPPSPTARYCVVTPYRQRPAAVTISPGHGIKLDLPNYAPGLAVIPIHNIEDARHYRKAKKSRLYRMALTIGFSLLLAACSNPQIFENLEETEQPSSTAENKAGRAGSARGLSGFYTALARLESGTRTRPVVVVHLGDSHIAGDGFSGDLREKLQQRFGAAGRGLMQPGKPYKYFNARGVITQQSPGWKTANSFNNTTGPYSITGIRLEAAGAGEVLKLEVKNPARQNRIEIEFLTGPGAGSVELKAGEKIQTMDLASADIRVRRFKTTAREVSIKTLDDRRVSVLGWSSLVENPGIRYVSLGLPGASVSVMAHWNKTLVKADLRYLKPDLIVLGYGTNEGFKDNVNSASYQRRYEALAGSFQKLAGNPSLLILGAPDGARLPKYARNPDVQAGCKALSAREVAQYSTLLAQKSEVLARWHAPPGLARVRQAQRRAAENLKAAYWDWSKVMGGACGTFRWANAKPALAYRDKVHFTDAGAKRSAQALYNFLMKGYGQFS